MDRISIGLVVGKAAVSKFAVERNGVKTRFKAAMREALQREQAEGRRLLLSGKLSCGGGLCVGNNQWLMMVADVARKDLLGLMHDIVNGLG